MWQDVLKSAVNSSSSEINVEPWSSWDPGQRKEVAELCAGKQQAGHRTPTQSATQREDAAAESGANVE